MNIFGESFLEQLKKSIISIVQAAVNVLVEKEKPIKQRYLNQKQAIEYLGGMRHGDFKTLVDMGLKIIVIERPYGPTTERYDVADLDEFMARHKI